MKPDSHFNKILITGINGFTGVHLEKYLHTRGFDVYGTVIDEPKQKNHLHCDITKKEQIDKVIASVKPDYVIHIAAISFVGESNASLIYDVNVIGTENILQSLRDNSVKPEKVILASSATVYGNQGKEVLDESMCPQPVNHYGCSKLSMEHMASNYFNDFDVIITRPFNYTGIGQESHFLIPKIVDHFKKGKKEIELGNIHVAREFNDINYVIGIYHKLLFSEAKSTIVNLSSNNPVKLLDVIEVMQEIAGYRIEVKVNPAFVRPNEIKSLAGSTEKLAKIIDLSDTYSLKETLMEMYEN
ncbi:GDP-mannose 4,6-dehydratase [Sulfurovum sp. NBC37-1]|uniref:GDP-mannose 4,6-dehydratase n=1 Tax=Sulfurovum sp. (strain NBC37-1) TaxID=387093 RepID=UPI000158774A|nr:GDP-mannose 4,6-dehydratase [Sulfurovum sp. NBC37-1]BAF71303.1 NAD-dependent epimerase/dehydratase [Sulfurovum sp. NBC37-1]